MLHRRRFRSMNGFMAIFTERRQTTTTQLNLRNPITGNFKGYHPQGNHPREQELEAQPTSTRGIRFEKIGGTRVTNLQLSVLSKVHRPTYKEFTNSNFLSQRVKSRGGERMGRCTERGQSGGRRGKKQAITRSETKVEEINSFLER